SDGHVRGGLGGLPPDGRARRAARGDRRPVRVPVRGPVTGDQAVTGLHVPAVDLRHAPLGEIRAVDFRAADRDLWADEAAMWDRLLATWAGLDEAAWHLPGAAPSDAGGPDWSLAEHVGHLADWMELAETYTDRALTTGV